MEDHVLQGLWPIELCDETRVYEFHYRGKLIQKSFVAEMALSGRSSCRKCHVGIFCNELRIGVLRWIPHIGNTLQFYHVKCFKRSSSLVRIEDFQLMDSLTTEAESKLLEILQRDPSKRRKKRTKEVPTVHKFCFICKCLCAHARHAPQRHFHILHASDCPHLHSECMRQQCLVAILCS